MVSAVPLTALTVTSAGTAMADSGPVFTVSPSPTLPAGSGLNAITTSGETDAWAVGETLNASINQDEPLVEQQPDHRRSLGPHPPKRLIP